MSPQLGRRYWLTSVKALTAASEAAELTVLLSPLFLGRFSSDGGLRWLLRFLPWGTGCGDLLSAAFHRVQEFCPFLVFPGPGRRSCARRVRSAAPPGRRWRSGSAEAEHGLSAFELIAAPAVLVRSVRATRPTATEAAERYPRVQGAVP